MYKQMLQLSNQGASFSDASNVCLCSSGPHIFVHCANHAMDVQLSPEKMQRTIHGKNPCHSGSTDEDFLNTLNIQKEDGEPCTHCPTAS